MRNEWLHASLEKALSTDQHDHPTEHPQQPAVVWYLPEEDQDEEFPLSEIPNFNVRPGRVTLEASQQINAKIQEVAEKLLISKELGKNHVIKVGVIRPHHNESWYHDLALLNSTGTMAGVYMQGWPEGELPSRMEMLQAAGYNVWSTESALRQGIIELSV